MSHFPSPILSLFYDTCPLSGDPCAPQLWGRHQASHLLEGEAAEQRMSGLFGLRGPFIFFPDGELGGSQYSFQCFLSAHLFMLISTAFGVLGF